MKRYFNGRRAAGALLALIFFAALAAAVFADAAPEDGRTIDIGVSVTWDHGTASPDDMVTEATFLLTSRGVTVATLTLREDDLDGESGAWSGAFRGVPAYDENGRLIAYTVKHDEIENYDTEVLAQPKIRGFSASFSNTRKILMPGETAFTDKMMVCVIGQTFYVWTADELFAEEKDAVIAAVNASRPGGIAFEMTKANSYFFSGETDEMNIRGSVMRFTKENGRYTVTLHDNRVWKYYYAGDFTLPYATDAVFIDTYREPAVTDVPMTDEPMTDAPMTDEPTTDVPMTDAPVTEAPDDTGELIPPAQTGDGFGTFLAVALLVLVGGSAAALLKKE